MNRLTRHGAVGAVVAAMFAAVGSIALAPPAGASTVANTLSGEGGTFLQPVVTKLVSDSSSNLDGLFGAFVATGLDTGIRDFVGSGKNAFNADFAVTERPLNATESSTATANGRTYAYVPFAATPVAIGTLVPTSAYSGGNTIDSADLCPHINLTVADVGAIYGYDNAQPVNSWNDPRFTCSNGLTLGFNPSLAANDDPSMANYALMTLLDSDPTAKSYFAAGLQHAFATHSGTTSSTTPTETWPYTGADVIAGGDYPLVGKLLTINATTNAPSTVPAQLDLGATFPISSVWTGSPLGAPWNIPTAAIQNAAGSFVAPSSTSAAAAEASATLAATSDPTTNNLVTFDPTASDATAYNNYLMEESYLVVPTNGLSATKATALANLIRFALGPDGQQDITSFGAAPATAAMDAAGLAVAGELDAEAAEAPSTASRSSTTTTTTNAAGTSGAATTTGSDTGSTASGSTTDTSGTSSSSGLAFTGSPDLVPLVASGVLLLVVGAVVRRRLRRRPARS
ncbi:MAG TPA: hypothetical protein VIH95_02640 [Acidimicrobiales bacterium]